MQKKLINTLLISLFLLVMSACHENDKSGGIVSTPQGGDLVPMITTGTMSIQHDYSFVWNINNPYDSIGFLHNEALDYFILHNTNTWTPTLSLNQNITNYYNVVYPYFASQGDNKPLQYYIDFLDTLFNYLPENDYTFSQYLLNKGYSSEVVSQIDNLFNLTVNHSYDAIDLCNSIKAMEDAVVMSAMPNNEKQMFLIGSAVVKFSSTYWIEVKNDPNNDWHDNGQPLPLVGPLTRAIVDAAGAIATLSFSGGSAATAAFVMTDSIANAIYKCLRGLPQTAADFTNFP